MNRTFLPAILSISFLILTGCASPDTAATSPVFVHHNNENVLALGGSVAEGSLALHDDGYLQRAFQSLTNHTNTTYHLFDKAIYGANSTQMGTLYKGRYSSWIHSYHPQVVVLSWGLINDALPKTPESTFDYWLKHEIDKALSVHAEVLVVTPPVTEVAYTQFKSSMQGYVNDEIHLVNQMHNQNVKMFDLFDQMKADIALHHQSYRLFVGDAHHPNTRGHILAGEILYRDLIHAYGKLPIHANLK